MLLAHATGRWVARRTTRAREANADLTSTLQEYLTGIRVLRLFGRAGAAVERVAVSPERFARAQPSARPIEGGSAARLRDDHDQRGRSHRVAGQRAGDRRGDDGGAFVAYLELFLRFVNRGHRIPSSSTPLQSGAAAYARLRPLLAPALAVAGEPRLASFRADHLAGITQRPPPARRQAGPASLSLRNLTFTIPAPTRRHSAG